MAKDRIKIGEHTVKVALEAIYTFLSDESIAQKQIGTIIKDSKFINLLVAQRGGGNTEENWLEVDGQKVGRSCAILGAFYPHKNGDKAVSHFYNNGSYHIVIEKLKNVQTKAHRLEQQVALQALEDDMMEGVITPKEWKQAKDEALTEFKFSINDDTKAYLVELTGGYNTKEQLAEAIADEAINTDYTEISEKVDGYLKQVEAQLFPESADEA